MSYLIDTDWLIDGLNGATPALELRNELNAQGLSTSIVTVGELYDGAFRHANAQPHLDAVRDFLIGYDVLGLSDESMETFARIRFNLRSRGQLIPDLELLIAATAIEHDLTLVTRNIRHFGRIGELSLYSVGHTDNR